MKSFQKSLTVGVAAFASLFLLAACAGGPKGMTAEGAQMLAQCLSDNGAKMYGAFWCPHCADQKKMFGSEAEELLPYRECDPKGENPVTEECLALEIAKYPTWIFADGTRVEGVLEPEMLAEKTGCEVPLAENS